MASKINLPKGETKKTDSMRDGTTPSSKPVTVNNSTEKAFHRQKLDALRNLTESLEYRQPDTRHLDQTPTRVVRPILSKLMDSQKRSRLPDDKPPPYSPHKQTRCTNVAVPSALSTFIKRETESSAVKKDTEKITDLIRDSPTPEADDYSTAAQIIRYAQEYEQIQMPWCWTDYTHITQIEKVLTTRLLSELNAKLTEVANSSFPLWRDTPTPKSYQFDLALLVSYSKSQAQKRIDWRVHPVHTALMRELLAKRVDKLGVRRLAMAVRDVGLNMEVAQVQINKALGIKMEWEADGDAGVKAKWEVIDLTGE